MRVRDILIVAAVLLVGGFAVADALRGNAEPRELEAEPTGSSLAPEPAETEPIETIRGVRPGVLAGRLLFSDQACRLRELDLRSGRLAPYAVVQSTCSLIAPSGGDAPLAAVALPSPRRDVLLYRVVDLARSDPHVASFRARTRSVVWSPNGTRVAWCEPTGRGQELVLGSEPHTLPGCPVAYTPVGDPSTRGPLGWSCAKRRFSQTPGPVEALSFAPDGSAAVAARGTRLLHYTLEDGGFVEERRVDLPPGLRRLRTLFSPTHCHAALLSGEFPPSPTVFAVNLRPCAGSRAPLTFSGQAAAWSPDGRWLAVAERERVVVQPLFEDVPALVLRITATDLAWRP